MKLGQWLDYWLEEIVKPKREPTTYEGYEIAVRLHIKPYLGGAALLELEPEHVELWLGELEKQGTGARTRQVAFARLRTALGVALGRGHVRRNVAALVERPKVARRKHPAPNLDDLRQLLKLAVADRHGVLVFLALGLGLRRGEVLGLQWADVDLERRTLRVGRRVSRVWKVGLVVREGMKMHADEGRVLAMPDVVAQALSRQLAYQREDYLGAAQRWKGRRPGNPRQWVVHSEVGTVLEPRRVDLYFASVRERLGMDARTFHGLRKDFGSLLLATGVPGRVVQEMLGHSDYGTTANIYQAVPDELQQLAAEQIDRLLSSG